MQTLFAYLLSQILQYISQPIGICIPQFHKKSFSCSLLGKNEPNLVYPLLILRIHINVHYQQCTTALPFKLAFKLGQFGHVLCSFTDKFLFILKHSIAKEWPATYIKFVFSKKATKNFCGLFRKHELYLSELQKHDKMISGLKYLR